MDDIPEAIRQSSPDVEAPAASRLSPLLIWGGAIGLATLAIGLTILWVIRSVPTPQANQDIEASASSNTPEGTPLPEALLGHFPYTEAPAQDLVALPGYETIQLRNVAAEAFQRMSTAALNEGMYLVPLSGFRSIADQEYLFFEVKEERAQVATQRAEVSAPPGHSEHHTGYAIDIGDADQPDTHLSESFEQTPAFQWLAANAARYSFELSFPKGNAQNISYEPWHWRFVGDQESLETFYSARQDLDPQSTNN